MTPIERELHRAAVKNKKERLPGIHSEVCIGCAADLASGKEDDHMIGRKHGDLVWPLCVPNCHHKRSELQREEPPPTGKPRNALEVIGRWLLSVAEYFELMCETFRRFGEFLIELARQGYGAELTLP
jgi:hypothetical protein